MCEYLLHNINIVKISFVASWLEAIFAPEAAKTATWPKVLHCLVVMLKVMVSVLYIYAYFKYLQCFHFFLGFLCN